MGVVYKGKEPRVIFNRSVLDAIQDFFDMYDRKATVFLSATKDENCVFEVDGWYVPLQGSTKYTNIITEEDELSILGSSSDKEGKSVYYGVICGGGDTKAEISTYNREYFEKLFNGVPEFFYVTIDKNGYMFCEVQSKSLLFTDVAIDIIRPEAGKDFLDELREVWAKRTKDYATGTQAKRSMVVPSVILERKVGWRDVV